MRKAVAIVVGIAVLAVLVAPGFSLRPMTVRLSVGDLSVLHHFSALLSPALPAIVFGVGARAGRSARPRFERASSNSALALTCVWLL